METERLGLIVERMSRSPSSVSPALAKGGVSPPADSLRPRKACLTAERDESTLRPLAAVSEQAAEASYRCQRCGYGFKHKDRTGIRKWCKRCIDVYHRKNELTPEKAERIIFKTVEPLYADARLQNVDEGIRRRLAQLKDGDDVFLYGRPGVGKTYIMAALIRRFVYQGYECRRINFDDFCIELRSTMSPATKKTEWELIEPLKQVDKLFIDDLGLHSRQETDYAYTTFYSILNKRQERLLSTFVSSNKDLRRIGQAFDTRVASRLRAALIIEIKGQDKRQTTEDG